MFGLKQTGFLLGCIITLSLCLLQCKSLLKQPNHPDLPKTVTISDARIVLQHFVHGSVPDYALKPSPFAQFSLETLSQHGFCFAKCASNEFQQYDVYDCFQINTKAFLVPFAQGIKGQELTAKTYLNSDQTVEKWEYGNHWLVIVNNSEEDYLHQNILLPPYGFIAVGPDFLTQHYYPHADDRSTMLFVQHHGERFTAFE